MSDDKKRPEWFEEEQGDRHASFVEKGVEGGHDGFPGNKRKSHQPENSNKRKLLSPDEYVKGVLAGDRTVLGRAITLIESSSATHMDLAQQVLKELLPHAGKSIRIGITGVPGSGKSTFIEALGTYLTGAGHKVAVMAVDPSSSVSKGSILGDKTRMEKLARDANAYIRPSPSGGTLGGVTRKTRESILVCEAAGYDVILIETVGVGQSEITVRSMVDFFLLLMITGAGDELQGIKRGVIEIADALVVNKADGDNRKRADSYRNDLDQALHYLLPATEGWTTHALACSSLTGEGIADVWKVVETFKAKTTAAGVFKKRRQAQARDWMHAMVTDQLQQRFRNDPAVNEMLPEVERAVMDGSLPPTSAARMLLLCGGLSIRRFCAIESVPALATFSLTTSYKYPARCILTSRFPEG